MAKKIAITVVLILSTLGTLEIFLRYSEFKKDQRLISTFPELAHQSQGSSESLRETESRFIIHNIALFEKNKEHLKPTIAFIGTSRTKVLAPNAFLETPAIVAGGNSYNEITWGLLLQAEALRLQFPELKTFAFEASLLVRRPGTFSTEIDHKKYFFLLRSLVQQTPELASLVLIPADLRPTSFWPYLFSKKLRLFHQRRELKLAKMSSRKLDDKKVYLELNEMPKLTEFGEPRLFGEPRGKEILAIAKDNPKVVRIIHNKEFIPGDKLFEAIALWSEAHDVRAIFFVPPLHRKFYEIKLAYGLDKHIADLSLIAKKYDIPIVNFLNPELGWIDSLDLFSDEDHMATCQGSYRFSKAMIEAAQYQHYQLRSVSAYAPIAGTKLFCE